MGRQFSIIISSYNRQAYLRQAIDSVLSQTFANYEIIVVDDGSTDGTPELLQSYGPRIRSIRQLNQGPEVAHRMGASMANGEYLAFLDSDDLFLPWALTTYDKIIRAFNSPAVILGSMTYFEDGQDVQANGEDGGVLEVLRYRDFLSKNIGIGLGMSKIVIRKQAFERVDGRRNSTPESFHLNDYNLMLQVGTLGPCVILKQPITVAFRRHTGNSIHNIKAHVQGAFSLIRAERKGQYPGGRARQFARYARIGGVIWEWSGKALKGHCLELGVRLLVIGLPMVGAGIFMKIWGTFHRTMPLIL